MTDKKQEPSIPLKWFYKSPIGILFTVGGLAAIMSGAGQAISASWGGNHPTVEAHAPTLPAKVEVNKANIENMKEDISELKDGQKEIRQEQKALDRKYDEQMTVLQDIRRDLRRDHP